MTKELRQTVTKLFSLKMTDERNLRVELVVP